MDINYAVLKLFQDTMNVSLCQRASDTPNNRGELLESQIAR